MTVTSESLELASNMKFIGVERIYTLIVNNFVLKFANITTVRNVELLSESCLLEVVYVIANIYRLRTKLCNSFHCCIQFSM